MDPTLEHVQRSRQLIADLAAPAQPQLESPSRGRNPDSGLNEDQELAVDRSDFLTATSPTLHSGYLACHCVLCHFRHCPAFASYAA